MKRPAASWTRNTRDAVTSSATAVTCRSRKKELDAVEIESTHTVDIEGFVPREEIDKRYLDKPYYIAPNGKAGADAFAVIRDAMKDKDRVALSRIVIAHREHIMALEPLGKGILGTTLRYDYEVRGEKSILRRCAEPAGIERKWCSLRSTFWIRKQAASTPESSRINTSSRCEGS